MLLRRFKRLRVVLDKHCTRVVLGRVEGSHAILQTFEGSQVQSFEALKDYECNPLTLPRITNVILRMVEALHVIL